MTLSSRRGVLAALLCTAALALLSLADESYFGAEWLVRDWIAARLASRRPADPRIVIVGVTEKTARVLAADYGRPQSYSRALYAQVIDELRRAGASVIVFDLLLTESNDLVDPEGDRALAAALPGTPPVILAAESKAAAEPAPVPPAFQDDLWKVRGFPAAAVTSATVPLDAFGGAAGIGTIRLQKTTDRSGSVHAYPLLDRTAGGFLPGLALETWRSVASAPREAVWRRTLNGGELRVGRHRVPTDAEGNFAIRWKRVPSKRSALDIHYPLVDFDKVVVASMAHDDPAAAGLTAQAVAEFERQFRGKIAVIAFTAAGLHDVRSTPLSPFAAGVEIHANAVDNLINGEFDVAVNRWLVFPLIAAIAAAFGAAVDRVRSQVRAGALTVAVIGAVLGGVYLAALYGWILPAIAAAGAIALTYVAVTAVNFVAEQQQTAVLKTTFGRYVSPQILQHVLAHPERVELGGERRDLTILFSDIRGFTSISEASEPEQVVEMLNEYLTRMVEILLAHGGTLDKFIGDAVMGFWNAPAADPDHPLHAVACAIEMIDETAKLRERWVREGKAALRIGIGVNTGEAVVGNIGAEKVFGYTVIGDAVNLASRLEGKNKDYGTEIIISEFTLARIGEAFDTVYLDEVKVKGKEKAVKIYQVRGGRSPAASEPVREVTSHA